MAKRKPKTQPDAVTTAAGVEPATARVATTESVEAAPQETRESAEAQATPSPIVQRTEPPVEARPNPPGSVPFVFRSDLEAGIRLQEDRRFKQIQIAFAERPSDEVRYEIGNEGFRWRSQERVWTKQLDNEKPWQTRADAEALYERVAEMIRDEKGIGRKR